MISKDISAQKKLKACTHEIQVEVDNASPVDKDDLIDDSTKKELKLIFEQYFDGKVCILLNDVPFITDSLITIKNIGVCAKTISIDYSKYQQLPKISIYLVSSNDCISFYPKIGKRNAYINHLRTAWSIEVSNVIRNYR